MHVSSGMALTLTFVKLCGFFFLASWNNVVIDGFLVHFPVYAHVKLDIDECLTNNGGCHHNCQNSEGSFRCSCNDGYQLNSDGYSCEGNYG